MSFPVDAFQTCAAASLSKGEFFTDGQEWYLAVDYVGKSDQKISAIQVTNTASPAGPIWGDIDQRLKVMRIAKPYVTAIHSDKFPAALRSFTGMPIIVGLEPTIVGKFGHDEIVFTVSGDRRPDRAEMMRASQFSDWALWIAKEDGSKVGGEPLFRVAAV